MPHRQRHHRFSPSIRPRLGYLKCRPSTHHQTHRSFSRTPVRLASQRLSCHHGNDTCTVAVQFLDFYPLDLWHEHRVCGYSATMVAALRALPIHLAPQPEVANHCRTTRRQGALYGQVTLTRMLPGCYSQPSSVSGLPSYPRNSKTTFLWMSVRHGCTTNVWVTRHLSMGKPSPVDFYSIHFNAALSDALVGGINHVRH